MKLSNEWMKKTGKKTQSKVNSSNSMDSLAVYSIVETWFDGLQTNGLK